MILLPPLPALALAVAGLFKDNRKFPAILALAILGAFCLMFIVVNQR